MKIRNVFLFLLFFSAQVFAQNPFGASSGNSTPIKLYMSKQTKQFTFIEGTYEKTSDAFEDGTCALSKDGPIIYQIDSPPSYGPNETKRWTGKAQPDINSGPAAGSSASAVIKGNYDVHYSKPGQHAGVVRACDAFYTDASGTVHNPHGCNGYHTIINQTGQHEVNYEIISVKISIPEQIYCDGATTIEFKYDMVYPEGGTVEWTTPAGNFTGNEVVKTYQPQFLGQQAIAKYTFNGISYYDTAVIYSPTATITLPTEVECYRGITRIVAVCDPPFDASISSIVWTTPSGTPCSGIDCSFEIDFNLPPDKQKVTATYLYKCTTSLPAETFVKPNKLNRLILPCCVDTLKYVAAISQVSFDGPCELKVDYKPAILDPGPTLSGLTDIFTAYKTQRVEANTVNGNLQAQDVLLVNKNSKIIVENSQIQEIFKAISEKIKAMRFGPATYTPPSPPPIDDAKEPKKPGINKEKSQFTLFGSVKDEISLACCPERAPCLKMINSISGTVGAKGEISYDIPLAGIPKASAAGIFIKIAYDLGVTVSFTETCGKETEFCVKPNANLTISGGAFAEFAGGFVKGTLAIEAPVSASVEVCFSPPPMQWSAKWEAGPVALVGQISAGWGFLDANVNIPISGVYTIVNRPKGVF